VGLGGGFWFESGRGTGGGKRGEGNGAWVGGETEANEVCVAENEGIYRHDAEGSDDMPVGSPSSLPLPFPPSPFPLSPHPSFPLLPPLDLSIFGVNG